MQILASIAMIAMFIASPVLQAQNYTLPQDPTTPVITLDYQGDRLQRINDAPTLTILMNGDVIMPQSYAHTQAYQGQISEAELQQLLDFIIRENKFFDYDADRIGAKLSELEHQPLPVHFSTTVISVNAELRAKEVRLPALGRGPMVKETRQMLAIKQRLDKLMSYIKLGGAEQVAKLLAIANYELDMKIHNTARLSAEGLQVPSSVELLTSDDLESGGQRADGSIYVRFKQNDGSAAASVTIDIGVDGQRLVTVATDDQ